MPIEMQSHTNVDLNEVAKFDEHASRWWDLNGEFKPLHEINPLRLAWIESQAQLTGQKVLDVGCGGGILSESMAARGADVKGIDLAEEALEVARLHALETQTKVTYQATSVEALAEQEPESYDVVTCLEMLEHVPDPASVVKACAALCKPGGKLFFSTINRNQKSWLFAIVGAEYVLQLLPRGTHDWEKFIQPAELHRFCRNANIEPCKATGLQYNPVTKIYKLDQNDISVNYMMSASKPSAPN